MWRIDPSYGPVWDLADGPLQPLSPSAFFTTDAPQTVITELKPLDPPHGSLIAYLNIRMPSGLEIFGCLLHVSGSRVWVGPPSMPLLKNRQHVMGEDGKPVYLKVIGFSGNHGVRSRWSREIIAAVRRQYPSLALPTEDDEQEEIGRRFWGDTPR